MSLILTRKEGERIQIGDNISLKVILITGKSVKLAIDAPKDVNIVRSELESKEIEAEPVK